MPQTVSASSNPNQSSRRGGDKDDGGKNGNGTDDHEYSTETPWLKPGGAGAGADDDAQNIDRGFGEFFTWSPTSSPTSSPTGSHEEQHRGRGRVGGGGRDDASGRGDGGNVCLEQQVICLADSDCAACMAGATRDGSCDTTVPDCAGVADYYCCELGGTEGCSDNVLLLDFISEL